MAYYDALIAKWATLTGTTAAKLAAVNALSVPGPNVDVQVSSVVGSLMLSGAYLALQSFASGAGTGSQPHDNALGAAKLLLALITTPNAPTVRMSDPTAFATVKSMMDAILAQENAVPGSTGFTQVVHDALLALASTTIPWWRANGYPRAFDMGDINAAGLS